MIDATWIARHVLPAAYSVLPAAVQSREASALLLAIGWQESRYQHRRQINGPAMGFLQFEFNGVRGVLSHAASRPLVGGALVGLGYPATWAPVSLHHALEHSDVLTFALGRALLWTLPDALPARHERDTAWAQYLSAWRPGKPHPATWAEAWAVGWAAVDATT